MAASVFFMSVLEELLFPAANDGDDDGAEVVLA